MHNSGEKITITLDTTKPTIIYNSSGVKVLELHEKDGIVEINILYDKALTKVKIV